MGSLLLVIGLMFSGMAFGSPLKIAEFEMKPWYPLCTATGAGCWHNHKEYRANLTGSYSFVVESGDYGIRTAGRLYLVCTNGARKSFPIPRKLPMGFESPIVANPCKHSIRKISFRAGMNGTWGSATVSIWEHQ